MKRILAVLVLTVAISLNVGAQDVRSRVGPASGTSLTNMIDPDNSVYGAQWGSSEDEFISKFGQPTGYIRLNGAETAMLYGKSHAFIFTSAKLSGVRISMMVLDWKLSQAILALTPFDGIKWQLSNGIRSGINLAEVKKILGDKIRDDHPGRHQLYFNSENARVELEFSRVTSDGERDESYKLYGLYIRQASSASGVLRRAPVPARPPLQALIPEATQPTPRSKAVGDSDTRESAFVEKARASMVVIAGEDQVGQPIALGTGFVIGDNLIATNDSVVNSAQRVYVRVAGQEPQTLEIESRDSYRRAAILSVARTRITGPPVSPLLLGDSDEVAVKDKVYFAGDPEGPVSVGIVKEISAINGKRYFFEISARITGRSKGGAPLFNGEGEVIGILGERLKETDRFFAIPTAYLKTLLQYRNGGASTEGGEQEPGTRGAGGNPGADRPVSIGPGEEKSAGGGNAGPERNNPASASVDTKPLLLNNPPPRYTEEARHNKTQGAVNVAILVGEDGKVKQARVTKGLPDGLNEQAVIAAHQMRFKPAMRNGQPVSYRMRIVVTFYLR